MTARVARYDEAADWYLDFSRGWATDAYPFLPDDLSGQRVLELGCGLGELSRLMAGRGATVTAIDLSANMLAPAIEQEAREPLGISYVVGDVTSTDWWDGDAYHVVVANMCLMDIDDLAAAMTTATRVLAPGGWFSFSLLHPCFPGLTAAESEQLSSWPPDRGYDAEGWWTTHGEGVRGRVGANHRMLSTYLNAALRAGLELAEFRESTVAGVPRFLMVRCCRLA